MGFRLRQAADLIVWDGEVYHTGINRLLTDISAIIGNSPIPICEAGQNEKDEVHRLNEHKGNCQRNSCAQEKSEGEESVAENFRKGLELYNAKLSSNLSMKMLRGS
ncbi:MAG: hypothetical protein ACOYOE_02965 [Chlorobium sp.]